MKLQYHPESTHNILRLLTAALVAAFVLCGAWGHKAASCFTANGHGAFVSSDRLLADPLEVDDASEKILDSVSSVPPRQPVALLVPGANVYGPIFQVAISAIAWPHELRLIPVKSGNVNQTFDSLRKSRFGAALIFGVTPPVSDSISRHIGQLTIIPIPQ